MLTPFKLLATVTTALTLSCASQVALAQRAPISAPYLTGVWKENAQCRGNESMVFFPNGTLSSAGSIPVNYTVTGAKRILMYGPGGAVPIEIESINQNSMLVKFQGDAMVVHRCGANSNAPTPRNRNTANTANTSVSAGYIVGRWSHIGNCANPEVFSSGGHFMTSTHQPGTWAVFGNTLRLTMNNGNSIDFAVQIHDPRNMTLTQLNQGNETSHYSRC